MRRTVSRTFLLVSLVMVVAGSNQGQSAKHKPGAPLERTEWRLIWLGTTKIESGVPQQAPYIQLDPENHRVSGSGGCNRLMGGYELAGDHLKFTQMVMSRMACIHGGDTESNFAKALDQVKSWKVVGDKLLLMDAEQHVLAKFSGVQPES
jgi:heat shock protein HslJ